MTGMGKLRAWAVRPARDADGRNERVPFESVPLGQWDPKQCNDKVEQAGEGGGAGRPPCLIRAVGRVRSSLVAVTAFCRRTGTRRFGELKTKAEVELV